MRNILSVLNLVTKSDFDNLEEDYFDMLSKRIDLDKENNELFCSNQELDESLMRTSCELHNYKCKGLPIALFCGVAVGYFLR